MSPHLTRLCHDMAETGKIGRVRDAKLEADILEQSRVGRIEWDVGKADDKQSYFVLQVRLWL